MKKYKPRNKGKMNKLFEELRKEKEEGKFVKKKTTKNGNLYKNFQYLQWKMKQFWTYKMRISKN